MGTEPGSGGAIGIPDASDGVFVATNEFALAGIGGSNPYGSFCWLLAMFRWSTSNHVRNRDDDFVTSTPKQVKLTVFVMK